MGKIFLSNIHVDQEPHIGGGASVSIEFKGPVEKTEFRALNDIAKPGTTSTLEKLLATLVKDIPTKKTAKPILDTPSGAHFGGAIQVGGKLVYIKQVIYSGPATIVFWSDDTKTTAICAKGDTYSRETGLSVAVLKKLVGGDALADIYGDWLGDTTKEKETITLKGVRKARNTPDVKDAGKPEDTESKKD